MGKKKLGRILATGAAAAAAGVAAKKVYDTKKKKDEIQKEAVEEAVMKRRDYTGRLILSAAVWPAWPEPLI